jgi:hypothetical protein
MNARAQAVRADRIGFLDRARDPTATRTLFAPAHSWALSSLTCTSSMNAVFAPTSALSPWNAMVCGSLITTPRDTRKVERATLLATEKVLTAGQGKQRHIAGIEVVLAAAFDPAATLDVSPRAVVATGGKRSAPVDLQVSYTTPSGAGAASLHARARLAPTGQIIVATPPGS